MSELTASPIEKKVPREANRTEWELLPSRATSGGRRKDRNTNGQRGNNSNTSYRDRDRSVVVAENNNVVKPKCHQ